jgi:hypothetical protein
MIGPPDTNGGLKLVKGKFDNSRIPSYGSGGEAPEAPTTSPLNAIIDGQTVTFRSYQQKFDALADAWEEFNAVRGVATLNHSAYHQIMAMGERAIPMLLARLRNGEGVWVYALRCITGVQVDTPEMSGDPQRVIQAWLEWGKSRRRRGHG